MLTFSEKNHEYRLDGVTLPSVTQVLSAVGLSDMSKIPKDVLERACSFGKACHRAIELSENGTLDYDSLDPDLIPYLDGWKAFKEDFGYRMDNIEFKGHNSTYRYAFRTDHQGVITKGAISVRGMAIGDVKTGVPQPSHKYQLAAYKLAMGTMNTTFILYLNPDFNKGYKVIFSINDNAERNVFLAALTIYNVRKREGLL